MSTFAKEMKSLSESIRNQQNNLRINNSFALLRVAGLLDNLLDAGYRKIGLKRNHVLILSFILANGGTMTPTELKDKIFRSDNAISRSLDGLDKLGLTKSYKSKQDRRLRRVKLTEKGLEVLKEIVPLRGIALTEGTESLTQEEGEVLQSILTKLIDHLFVSTGRKPKRGIKKFYF